MCQNLKKAKNVEKLCKMSKKSTLRQKSITLRDGREILQKLKYVAKVERSFKIHTFEEKLKMLKKSKTIFTKY